MGSGGGSESFWPDLAVGWSAGGAGDPPAIGGDWALTPTGASGDSGGSTSPTWRPGRNWDDGLADLEGRGMHAWSTRFCVFE